MDFIVGTATGEPIFLEEDWRYNYSPNMLSTSIPLGQPSDQNDMGETVHGRHM